MYFITVYFVIFRVLLRESALYLEHYMPSTSNHVCTLKRVKKMSVFIFETR